METAPAPRVGVLLINIGTPASPAVRDVRAYLREFLGDPRVIDLPALGRWLLLNLIILPFRPRRSAHAYASIWTPEGSPLMVHGRALTAALAAALPEATVRLGHCYGAPSISAALDDFEAAGVDRVVVVPLYPQEAGATTGAALDRVLTEARRRWVVPSLHVLPPFYDHPAFIDAVAEVSAPTLQAARADHVLFSFHGVPERHVRRADASGETCLSRPDCCETLDATNRRCYRAHCFATARALTRRMGLDPARVSVSFQSRLGRTAWIGPYTEATLDKLAQDGVKRLVVLEPSFVADCLETLEEVGIRGRERFRAAGGEELVSVPCLNSDPRWVAALAGLLREDCAWLGSAPAEAPPPA